MCEYKDISNEDIARALQQMHDLNTHILSDIHFMLRRQDEMLRRQRAAYAFILQAEGEDYQSYEEDSEETLEYEEDGGGWNMGISDFFTSLNK